MGDKTRAGLIPGEPYSFWFPLALLGFLLLVPVAVALTTDSFGWFAYAPQAENHAVAYSFVTPTGKVPANTIVPLLAEGDAPTGIVGSHDVVTWVFGAAFIGTVTWYALRARKAGAPIRPLKIVVTAVGGLVLAVLAMILVFASTSGAGTTPVSTFGISFGLLGLCAGGWAFFGLGPGRRVAALLCAVLLPIGCYLLIVGAFPSSGEAMLVAAALFVLSWLERSVLLAAVAGVFTLSGLAFAGSRVEWLAASVVLIGGALVALVAARRATGAAGIPDSGQ